jgi:serine/threonine-protein kinase
MDFHVGQTFGEYSIVAILGAGAMERLFKVEHCLTKRTEAMKVLAAELATDTQIKRFEREMRALARLSHPHIAGLHHAVHSEKQLILFMEFIDGRTLESMLGAGRFPIDTGIEYIKQLLSALGYAHQQGVVHRDVTPANVIVTTSGDVKLTDFGLSKAFGDPLLTNCGEVLGSLPYLAPEQVKGVTSPDRRSDLYSVGAILYEHLTGQKPFGANRRLAPVLTDSEPEPQPPSKLDPSLPPKWDPIIRRALARNPEHRYQSAQEFLDAVVRLDEAPVSQLPLPQGRTMGIGVAIIGGLVLALVASPSLKSLRPVAPIIVPTQRLHIAPPDFATSIAVPEMTPPRPKRVVRVATAIVIEPPPAIAALRTAPIAPIPLPARAVIAPPPADPEAPDAPETAPERKKNFWSKLNVFKKKKNADSGEKP